MSRELVLTRIIVAAVAAYVLWTWFGLISVPFFAWVAK